MCLYSYTYQPHAFTNIVFANTLPLPGDSKYEELLS